VRKKPQELGTHCPSCGPQEELSDYCTMCGVEMVDPHGASYKIHGRVEDVLRVHRAIRKLNWTRNTEYTGPVFVISGNGAQLAWNNNRVVQNQTEQIAPGFEALAEAVAAILPQLHQLGLGPDDRADAEQTAEEILAETTKPEPDRSRIKRALTALKGIFAPVATGLVTGAGEGAEELAKNAIEALGAPFGLG
jgi:hypothetical protein